MTKDIKVLKRIIENERIVSQMEMLYTRLKSDRECFEAIDFSFCKEYGLDYTSLLSALLAVYSDAKGLKK